jgi:hypothetical protein
MRYEIPIVDFEEMIGLGLWVGHRFTCDGLNLVVTAIGQAQSTNGNRVVPVEIEYDSRQTVPEQDSSDPKDAVSS